MHVTPLNANRGFYFPTRLHLALRLQNSWVIRLKIMNELPQTVSPASCFLFFQFEPILNSQISHGNLHLGLFLKKLEDLEKPVLHGSYSLEMTSGCFYRQDLCSIRRLFHLLISPARYSCNHVQPVSSLRLLWKAQQRKRTEVFFIL